MPNDPDLLIFGQACAPKKPDSTWDKRGTSHEKICPKARQPSGELKALQIITITQLSHRPMR